MGWLQGGVEEGEKLDRTETTICGRRSIEVLERRDLPVSTEYQRWESLMSLM